YDITTMTGGAKDAAGSYSGLALEYIVSWDGALKIALFLLPTLLTAGIGVMMCVIRRCAYEQRPLVRENSSSVTMILIRCLAAVMAVLCFCSGVLLTRSNDRAWAIYKTEYNYQLAVRHFGLLTGMRLDLKGLIGGHSKGDFEEVPSIEVLQPTTPSDPTDVPEKPIEYGYNQLELNLSGGSGEIKDLNAYVQSLTASKKNAFTGLFKDKNLIMITAEAFSAEVIDPELTPTLHRLATKGVQFKDYYQPASAGTTGGEYQNIFGMLPTASGASFKNTADHFNYMTMGSQLDRLGYYGKAYHNNSYTYYSRHLTHNNLGYSDGFMGYGNGMEKFVKNRWPQSDMEMFQGTLPTYIDKEKFNVYYMTVSGHNGYTQSGNSMTARNWDLVKDLPYSDQIKGYLAANLELEKALTYLVEELEKKGIADDTVICMTSDHFPYGLDDAGLAELYGSAPKNYFDRDHSAWILWCGSLEKEEPIVVSAPTSSLDILPTLSNLFGTEFDARLFPGRDVFSDAEAIVFNSNYDWKTEYGTYFASNGKFIPAEGVEVPERYADRMKVIVR
ncbi:MAG: LTA synthase family protein, partial [Clostridia bacterium]|nr:LTA synthase family protein [Clostridia bacterium]